MDSFKHGCKTILYIKVLLQTWEEQLPDPLSLQVICPDASCIQFWGAQLADTAKYVWNTYIGVSLHQPAEDQPEGRWPQRLCSLGDVGSCIVFSYLFFFFSESVQFIDITSSQNSGLETMWESWCDVSGHYSWMIMILAELLGSRLFLLWSPAPKNEDWHSFCLICRILSWFHMQCEKNMASRDSIEKNNGWRQRFLLLVRSEGHGFHTAWSNPVIAGTLLFSLLCSQKYEL